MPMGTKTAALMRIELFLVSIWLTLTQTVLLTLPLALTELFLATILASSIALSSMRVYLIRNSMLLLLAL